MKTKKKLSVAALEVTSFVTNLKSEEKATIKGEAFALSLFNWVCWHPWSDDGNCVNTEQGGHCGTYANDSVCDGKGYIKVCE